MADTDSSTKFSGVTFTSTGITGQPGQEISRDMMVEWVADHADRDSAIKFDMAIAAAVHRDEEEGSLFLLMSAAKELSECA